MDNLEAKSCSSICDRESLAAFAIYFGLSLFFFGRGLIGHFGERYIGVGSDPSSTIFFIAWLRHAIENRTNPFAVTPIWEPIGVNLAHTAYPLLLGWLAAIASKSIGLIPSFNLTLMLGPATSAWAGFILFRQVCRDGRAAMFAGFTYGFSPFVLAHFLGQLNLAFICFVPLAIYLTVKRVTEEISSRKFTFLFFLILLLQFGCSSEIFCTASFFGGVAFLLAVWTADRDLRRRLARLLIPIVIAYAGTLVILAPYLYFLFVGGHLAMSPHLAISNSAKLANFIIPTQVNALGATPIAHLLMPRTHIYDTCAYIGVPALLVVGLVTARKGAELAVRLSVWMLLATMVLSIGPMLLTGPHSAIPMPEVFIYWFVPVLKYALPVRFAAFFFLCIGALFALWMSDHALSASVRLGLGALVILSLLPNLDSKFWMISDRTPEFFRNGAYRKFIARNENVLLLPYGVSGDSDLWQAQTDFYFRTAGGYLGITPPVPDGYVEWPIVHSLYGLNELPEIRRNVAAFLLNKHVSKVIVADGAQLWQWTFGDGPATWRLRALDADERAAIEAMFGWLDPAPLHIDGVTIYRIPLDRLGAYAQYTPEQLQLATARERMHTLVTAANSYLAQGGDMANLNLVAAADRGLFPRLWITGPLAVNFAERRVLRNGLRLEPRPDGLVEIAIFGTHDALEQVDRDYQHFDRSSRLLAPQPSTNLAEWSQSRLELRFDRAGLAAAAAAPAATL